MTNSTLSPKQARCWFFGAIAVAAALRAYLLWQYYCISSDGVVYIQAAKDFFAGDIIGGLGSVYPPGYPLLIVLALHVVGDGELAGQVLSFTFGIALLVPLYWIVRALFEERVALLACYLAAVSPFLALYSVHVRSESFYLFVALVALYLVLIGMQLRSLRRFFFGGALAGFAFLIRPEAIGFLAVVPGVAALGWLLRRDSPRLWLVQSSAVLCAGFMLLALPYIVYLSIDTGQFGALSRKAGVTLAINLQDSGLLDSDSGVQGDDVNSLVFVDYVTQHPLRYLKKIVLDLPPALWVFFEALHFSHMPFVLLGLYLICRQKFWQRLDLLLVAYVLFYIFGFALIYVKRRYSLQAVPITLSWVALAMCYVWDKSRAMFSPRFARFSMASLAIIFLAATLPKTLRPVSREKAYVRESGRYLKARNKSGHLRVAVFDDRVTFYAEAQTVLLLRGRTLDLAIYLRERNVDYLAAESKVFEKTFPEAIREPESHGLIFEKSFVGSRDDRMMLFKVS